MVRKKKIYKNIKYTVSYIKECSAFVFLYFRVSCLTFRPLIYFELIFVCDVKKCTNFML